MTSAGNQEEGVEVSARSAWAADLARYPKRPFLKEQSIWVLAVYRFGRWNDQRAPSFTRWLFDRSYWLAFRFLETLTGISINKFVEIGPGLRIWHFGNIFVHDGVKMGANCTLRHGATIGVLSGEGPVPVIEDDVEFGAYAQVLGGVRIGKGAKVGPMSVVLTNVPAGATAMGNPARILFQGKVAKAKTTKSPAASERAGSPPEPKAAEDAATS